MAQRHDELTAAGTRVAGISVDSPRQNAAMVDKLRLPFPLLSDPDGESAIRPYGVWHDERQVARPAFVLIDTGGDDVSRQVSRDYADRISEDELVAEARALGLAPVTQEPPAPGDPQPGERAMPVEILGSYYRGASFAVKALGMRVPEARDEAAAVSEQVQRYADAIKALRQAS